MTKPLNKKTSLLFAAAAAALWACDAGTQSQALGAGTPGESPAATSPATGGGNTGKAAGASCHSEDGSRLCVALKYVVFTGSDGKPAMSQADAQAVVKTTNDLWNQCGIAFQIDDYQEVSPTQAGIPASPAAMGDLDTIRRALGNDSTLLVATAVGTWGLSANAWTAMPGSEPYGAVIEGTVATYGPIIAHELGHYLNLDHVDDQSNLMNPVIYPSSTVMSEQQCSQARSAVSQFWSKMIR